MKNYIVTTDHRSFSTNNLSKLISRHFGVKSDITRFNQVDDVILGSVVEFGKYGNNVLTRVHSIYDNHNDVFLELHDVTEIMINEQEELKNNR